MNAIDRTACIASGITAAAATVRSALAGSRRGLLAHTGVAAVLALSSAACSGVTTAAPLATPVAHESAGPAACHASGATKVLARRVFVPAGVQASLEDGAFAVGYAADPSHCLTVEWPSGASHVQPGSCAQPSARTAARDASDETMLAWESRDGAEPHITLGVSTSDAARSFFGFGIAGSRHVVEQPFRPLVKSPGGETAPALAPIGHDRFLLAWVDGNVESHQLRAQSVVGWGETLGPSMVLSPADASVIGKPSVVVAPTGYGLVTYVASLEGEFDVMATPVACAMN
jgi:hypothetical protein